MRLSYGKKAAVVFVLSVLLAVAYVQSGRSVKTQEARTNQTHKVTTAQWEDSDHEGSSVYGR